MRVYSLLAVVVVLFTAFVIYQRSADQVTRTGGGSPQEQIDVTAIRQRLLTIAQTQRQYQAANGKYATLEELANEQLLPGGIEQRGYSFSAQVSATGFTITATPTDDEKEGWPILEVTEAMHVTQR